MKRIIDVVVKLLLIDIDPRRDARQIVLLKLVKPRADIGGQLIDLLFCLDRAAKNQFALRIFGREHFFPIHSLQFHLAFIIGENNLRFPDVDLGCPERAIIVADNPNAAGRVARFMLN
jgi:hypothetical protein